MRIQETVTNIFLQNLKAYEGDKHRIIVNEGGTGSSKTYSIAQLMCRLLLRNPNEGLRITISRKSLPTLKRTAMKDFFHILDNWGYYKESFHNKTDKTYKFGKNMVEFVAADSPQKLRSQRRDILWINESNEFDLETYRQFSMRTEQKVFLDYNPSDEFHWIYDMVVPRKDCLLIRSTYLDNPFLNPSLVSEIERYKDIDENYWKIYGLGLRGMSQAKIYNNWKLIDELPLEKNVDRFYGLDFGFNNATSLIEIVLYDDNLYWDQKIYQSRLTTEDLIAKMIEEKIDKNIPIYPDPSEPEKIYLLKKAGFHIPMKSKEKALTDNKVKDGIDYCKSRKIFVTSRSVELLKEIKSYSWKMKDGKITDEPVKVNDHAMDAARYGSFSHSKKTYVGFA